VSPVHFFWAASTSQSLAFSGRTAPLHPGSVPGLPDAVVREAYSHEVSSGRLLARQRSFPAGRLLLLCLSEPAAFRDGPVPADAYYDMTFKEFILPYDKVRAAANPDVALLEFLSATMQLPLRAATGIARRWNAPWVFQRGFRPLAEAPPSRSARA